VRKLEMLAGNEIEIRAVDPAENGRAIHLTMEQLLRSERLINYGRRSGKTAATLQEMARIVQKHSEIARETGSPIIGHVHESRHVIQFTGRRSYLVMSDMHIGDYINMIRPEQRATAQQEVSGMVERMRSEQSEPAAAFVIDSLGGSGAQR